MGTKDVGIVWVEHANGKNLAETKRCTNETGDYAVDITAHNDISVVAGLHNVQIWNHRQGERLHTVRNVLWPSVVAASEKILAMGGFDGVIDLLENHDGYKLLRSINTCKLHNLSVHNSGISDIIFLNPHTLIVTTVYAGLFFVSLPSGRCIHHWPFGDLRYLRQTAVLADGRVCVAGDKGYCAILPPPQEVKHIITEYAQRMRGKAGKVSSGMEGLTGELFRLLNKSEPEMKAQGETGAQLCNETGDQFRYKLSQRRAKRGGCAGIVTGGDKGGAVVGVTENPLESTSARANSERGSGLEGKKNQERDIGQLWKKMEMMEQRHSDKVREMETEMAKMNWENKKQALQNAKMELKFKEQEANVNRTSGSWWTWHDFFGFRGATPASGPSASGSVGKVTENKEEALRIAKMELLIKQHEAHLAKVDVLLQESKAQCETVAQLPQQRPKRRRNLGEESTAPSPKSHKASRRIK